MDTFNKDEECFLFTFPILCSLIDTTFALFVGTEGSIVPQLAMDTPLVMAPLQLSG